MHHVYRLLIPRPDSTAAPLPLLFRFRALLLFFDINRTAAEQPPHHHFHSQPQPAIPGRHILDRRRREDGRGEVRGVWERQAARPGHGAVDMVHGGGGEGDVGEGQGAGVMQVPLRACHEPQRSAGCGVDHVGHVCGWVGAGAGGECCGPCFPRCSVGGIADFNHGGGSESARSARGVGGWTCYAHKGKVRLHGSRDNGQLKYHHSLWIYTSE
ncbi:hypothetical protein B0J12DRAFT_44143 [Macrophomina phaseolina]|uniref:Uncharacterized protein n=1 Tax=Macrophomina phaseolina TaxID=35725 RepID=A0ABQ8GDQ3_9PEZI|nr:hypothetical protein B0J12DRAFT_44143 [Macrophomina phaseolina]